MEMGLNGFRVEVRPGAFEAYIRDFPDAADLKEVREAAGDAWALRLQGGLLYGVPQRPGVRTDGWRKVQLNVAENLTFVAYLVNNALPRSVPHYSAFRERPFTFLGEKREFVGEICRQMPSMPAIMGGFSIRPRYTLEARVIIPAEEPFLALFVAMKTRKSINADLADLAAAGVHLGGFDVLRRNPLPDQRSLVGTIERLDGPDVILSESFDSITRMKSSELALEASSEAFASCLRMILGSRYEKFERARQRLEGELLGGPGVDEMLVQMGKFLSAAKIDLGSGLECRVGERLILSNTTRYRSVVRASPVTYCFDPARAKRSSQAWQGLATYGPFSRESFAKKSPTILVVAPDKVQGTAETFVRALRDGVAEGVAYPAGLASTFALTNPRFVLQRVESSSLRPHEAYRNAIEQALSTETKPDIALVVLQDEHRGLPPAESPYLHAKAMLLMAAIPSQEVRISTIKKSAGLGYKLRNISTALYAKMNGVPWTVDQHLPIADEIVVGLGVAEQAVSRYRDKKRYVGVTTVFRGDGNYLLGTSRGRAHSMNIRKFSASP